jgi:Cdc6-like AAA superfamily ATPase
LCVVAVVLKRIKKEATVDKFHSYYSQIARRLSLPVISSSDFHDVFSSLEANGLVQVHHSSGRDSGMKRVTMNISYDDVKFSLSHLEFFENMLRKAEELDM